MSHLEIKGQAVTSQPSVLGCGPLVGGRGGKCVQNLTGLSGHRNSAPGSAQAKVQLEAVSSQHSLPGVGGGVMGYLHIPEI